MGERRRIAAPPLRRLVQFLGPPEEQWERLLLLAVVVGLVSGAAGVGLRTAVHHLVHALEPLRDGWTAALLPAGGALLGILVVAFVFREGSGHGVPEVIRAVCRGGGRMRVRAIFSRWVGSCINVSAGGSAGLEGPIVYTGAALGSSIGGLLRLDERRRSVLLACGVAGGIGGVFNAPMTGLVFAMEVVLAEWSAFSIVPVVVAAVSATELSRLVLGNEPALRAEFGGMTPYDLLACLPLGVAAGFASTGLTRGIGLVHRLVLRLPRARLVGPVVCGLAVGLVGLALPGAIGEGYDATQLAIGSSLESGLLLALALLLAKGATTGLTLGSGAPGGVFAPCLVLGSFLGVAFSRLLAEVAPVEAVLAAEGDYALVAMAGLVAGVMQAPLTGILLVMEVVDGYDAILPLMIVSVLSLLVARRFDRYSLYTRELAETGELLRPGTDKRILADVRVREALDRDVTPVPDDMTLADFVAVVKGSRRNQFPVLRAGTDEYVGMLDLSAVRELLLDPELARLTLVGTMTDSTSPALELDASLDSALDVFERTGAWVLPVLDGPRFGGLLSKSTLFDHYRRELVVQKPGE